MATRRGILTFLAGMFAGTGLIGLFGVFVRSMAPTYYRSSGGDGSVVDISKLPPGRVVTTTVDAQTISILRRTPEMIAALSAENRDLRDPDSEDSQQPDFAGNALRSLVPEILVVRNQCTHLGCSTTLIPPGDEGKEYGLPNGGFFCPCHGASYDLSGRVYENKPAPRNMVVPDYEMFDDQKKIRILGPYDLRKKPTKS